MPAKTRSAESNPQARKNSSWTPQTSAIFIRTNVFSLFVCDERHSFAASIMLVARRRSRRLLVSPLLSDVGGLVSCGVNNSLRRLRGGLAVPRLKRKMIGPSPEPLPVPKPSSMCFRLFASICRSTLTDNTFHDPVSRQRVLLCSPAATTAANFLALAIATSSVFPFIKLALKYATAATADCGMWKYPSEHFVERLGTLQRARHAGEPADVWWYTSLQKVAPARAQRQTCMLIGRHCYLSRETEASTKVGRRVRSHTFAAYHSISITHVNESCWRWVRTRRFHFRDAYAYNATQRLPHHKAHVGSRNFESNSVTKGPRPC